MTRRGAERPPAARAAPRPPARAVLSLLFAFVAATGLLAAPPTVPEVRAATPDLTIVSAARYVVQPDQQRVRVTLDLTLTNHLTDTVTKRYYFDKAYLAVLPSSSAYLLTWAGSGTPSVKATTKTKDYTILRLDLAKRLYSGKSASYTLRFDIVDKGGKATRDIRIGDSLVSFPVWSFASDATPGSSVSVVFPAGYQVTVNAGSIPAPTTDTKGRTVFRTGRLDKPLSFFAFLVADRPGSYRSRVITPTVGDRKATIDIRAWPDDPAWDKRVGGLVGRALPVLGTEIGLPWTRTDTLTVQEAVSRSTSGYAGLFDPSKGLVEVAYYANDFVVLHESAHAWFNGALLADRWANEAFASYYALQAAAALKVKATGDVLTAAIAKAKIPLNAWGAVGREPTSTEDYAYAATLALATAIGKRAGVDGLQRVWADAAAGIGAYQPATGAAAPEHVNGAPDWRGLLDLLEDDTSAAYDDLWRQWVARDEDLPLLDARQAARARYAAVVADAGEWTLPAPIRAAMRAWQFEDASAMLDQAAEVLTQRDLVEAAAAKVDLVPPPSLRTAFEGDDGFDDALAEATAELKTIARYADALAVRPVVPDQFVTLGLWNETPDADLAAARAAFAAGDLSGSATAADRATLLWSGAEALGQGRAISLAALVLAVLMAIGIVLLWARGRRRRHRRRNLRQAHLIKR